MRTVAPNLPYEQYDEKVYWWLDLNRLLAAEFWALAFGEHSDESVAFLARQFGQHGAEADMRLLLAAPEVFLAQTYEDPGGNIPLTSKSAPERRRGAAKMRDLQLLVARIQVEMFLRDKELFDRYYKVLIWSHEFLGRPDITSMYLGYHTGYFEDGLGRSDESDDYWWCARNFVLLAHATSRDDLLKGADPSNLGGRCDKLHAWIMSNHEDLMPHPTEPVWSLQRGKGASLEWGDTESRALRDPAAPFDDWDDAVPFFTRRMVFWHIRNEVRNWLYSGGKTYEHPLSRRPSP